MTTAQAEPIIRLAGLHKAFGGTVALHDVSLDLRPGEVHCLAGENGAGKSTLIRILTGAVRRDAGAYRVDGSEMPVALTPAAARAAGIAAVYQELSLLPDLSVAENLLMGSLPARVGVVDRKALHSQATQRLSKVELDALDPALQVSRLPAATRQLVEIATVLGDNSRVIILDEPTTALSGTEAAALLRTITRLRDDGVAILYVSHRLEEMFEIGDRITVLRDGQVTRTAPIGEFTEETLISAMVGRDIDELYPGGGDRADTSGTPLLRVRGLRPPDGGHPVDLDVHAGEIVGIAGLLGAGRSELLRAIFGADKPVLVILTKGIDLSVGSVVGLTGAVAAQLLVMGLPIPLAVLCAVLCAVLAGAAVGTINGLLVAYAKLPPFIVTLGMMGAARGLVLVITNANTIQPLPEGFSSISNGEVLGVPNLLLATVIVLAMVGFLLRRTVFGRYVYAAGSNTESARLSGVPVHRVLVTVYAMSGLLAGLGGVLLASRLDAGVPTMGETYELDAIAACVIGGASLFGAKGGALGAACGALITSTLNNGGNLLGVNSFYLRIAIGVLILLAVLFDQVQGRLAARSESTARSARSGEP